jgi:UDP-N-acetylmuramate dehydrogenase
MDMDGNQKLLSNEEMNFSYRNSRAQLENWIILFADFALQSQPEVAIREKMQELMAKRRASQPLDLPSAGSAFKRPATGYAAAMIDQAGLKGFRIGDAAVSEKHAGFVVNLGSASAQQVKTLLAQVSDRVFEATGIRLEPEVRIW